MSRLKTAAEQLLSAVLTKQCRFCGKVIEPERELCCDCEATVSFISGERCNFCGAEKKRCTCKNHRMRYDGITAPFYYEDCAQTALLRLKFGNKEFVAHTLAQDMADAVRESFCGIHFDLIAFVPFSRQQIMTRHYNQSELLAYSLSHFLKIPVKNIMVKLFDTEVQHTLGGRERTGNVIGVYDIKPKAVLDGLTVLLVDDIKTTGATLNECARILKLRGAEKVYCVTAALAAKKKDHEQKNQSDLSDLK